MLEVFRVEVEPGSGFEPWRAACTIGSMKRSLPPLNAVRAFEAYARHGRMAAAAEELCVTHGAVSRQLKRLEAHLGVALLVREAGASRLTEAGRMFAGELHRLFDELEQAAPVGPGDASRRLELLCPGGFSINWLLPRLGRFEAFAPEVRLEVTDSSRPWRPASDGPHLAIRIQGFEGVAAAEVDGEVFMERFTGPVLSPALAARTAPTRAALMQAPRLHTRSLPREWSDWAAATGAPLAPAPREFGFDRSFHTFEAAASGLGVAIGDWAVVRPDIESGALVAPLGFERSCRPYLVLWRSGDGNPDVGAFRGWLRDEGERMGAPGSPEHAGDFR
jgi:DNA-binding transcriptional LysR family regulator